MGHDIVHILVVDDDDDLAGLLTAILTDAGYEVDRVATAQGLWRHVAAARPDLILLDVMLPDMDGFSVLQRLREREEIDRIPVILLTAVADPQNRVRGIRLGADDYIAKPFDLDELVLRVGLRLNQSRQMREQRQAAVSAGLQAIGHAVATPEREEEILSRAVALTCNLLNSSVCGILLWHGDDACFLPAASTGLPENRRRVFEALRIPAASLPSLGTLVSRRRPFSLPADAGTPLARAALEMFQIETALGAPIVHGSTLYGMLVVGRAADARPFAPADMSLTESLAQQIGLALANRRAMAQLEQLAVTDFLTGLYNPRYFREFLSKQLGRAQRSAEPTSLLMLDLDHFKQINDTRGHQAGDRVLAAVGATVRTSVRQGDVAVRYGGEEMAVILPAAGRDQALAVAERIRQRVRDLRVQVDGDTIQVTVSIGVALAGEDDGPEDLIGAADAALYAAKQDGRDRVR